MDDYKNNNNNSSDEDKKSQKNHSEIIKSNKKHNNTDDDIRRRYQKTSNILKDNNNAKVHSLKFYTVQTTTESDFFLVVMEFSNHNSDLNIYFKAQFLLDTLRIVVENDEEEQFAEFAEVISKGRIANVRECEHGKNVGKQKLFNGKSYPENINYFLIPKHYGKAKEVINRFIQEIKKIILSRYFFIAMESYAEGNYGKIGLALTNEDHSCWSQIRNPSVEIIYLETLDEKFLDQDIDIILTKMFG